MSANETEILIHLPEPHAAQSCFIDSRVKRKVVRSGRRSGKTVGVGILAVEKFLEGHRVLYGAPTIDQVGRFWVTVVRALEPAIDAGYVYKNETEHILEFPGTEHRIKAKTCWNADTLRGDYADVLILDEWQMQNEDAWGVVGAPMLLDNNGDAIFIYTPPSLHNRSTSKATDPQHAAKLFKRAAADTTGRWATFHFTSADNPYISQDALADIAGDMSALAYRMEILAEDVDEAPGALWTRAIIESGRLFKHPQLDRIVVGVDPSATSTGDEAGIVTAGKAGPDLYMLEDNSLQGSPTAWAAAAVAAYHRHKADRIVAEANNGGEMVAQTIKTVDATVPVKLVHASRGKQTRAEPISAIYEQGRGHHVGSFPKLEDEMCLAGDTLVVTATGDRLISDIRCGDEVLTRKGYRKVLWAGITNQAANVTRVTTVKGRHLLITVSHPVYTKERGFVRVDSLKMGDTLEVRAWHISRLNNTSTVSRLSGMSADGSLTIAGTTWTEKAYSYTAKSGKRIMGQFQKAASFITRMRISSILIYPTWSLSRLSSMSFFIPGTNGTNSNAKPFPSISKSDGQIQNYVQLSASDAVLNSRVQECEQCSALVFADVDTIQSIEATDIRIPVYNLWVDDVHEFYANGILVHNCLWVPGMPSPNRMDALVWTATELMGKAAPPQNVTFGSMTKPSRWNDGEN